MNTATANVTSAKTNAEITAEVEELRRELQSQKEELQLIKEELAKRDRQIGEERGKTASADSKAIEVTIKASEAVAISAEVKTTAAVSGPSVTNLAASNAAASNAPGGTVPAPSPVATSGQNDEEKGPLTIRFKGISITPGGFIAAETVNRQRALSDDINTQFNANAVAFPPNSHSKTMAFWSSENESLMSLSSES
jgi:hypothetical protein